jgi:hypothetical protein
MKRSRREPSGRPIGWTIGLTVLGTLAMAGILTLFYATEHKSLAMRLMRAINPMSSMLPWVTQNMRPNVFTVRLYDFLVLLAMAIQSCALGLIVDLVRWFRRRRSVKGKISAW